MPYWLNLYGFLSSKTRRWVQQAVSTHDCSFSIAFGHIPLALLNTRSILRLFRRAGIFFYLSGHLHDSTASSTSRPSSSLTHRSSTTPSTTWNCPPSPTPARTPPSSPPPRSYRLLVISGLLARLRRPLGARHAHPFLLFLNPAVPTPIASDL